MFPLSQSESRRRRTLVLRGRESNPGERGKGFQQAHEETPGHQLRPGEKAG